jgi:hypothetical protein
MLSGRLAVPWRRAPRWTGQQTGHCISPSETFREMDCSVRNRSSSKNWVSQLRPLSVRNIYHKRSPFRDRSHPIGKRIAALSAKHASPYRRNMDHSIGAATAIISAKHASPYPRIARHPIGETRLVLSVKRVSPYRRNSPRPISEPDFPYRRNTPRSVGEARLVLSATRT